MAARDFSVSDLFFLLSLCNELKSCFGPLCTVGHQRYIISISGVIDW